MSPRGLLNTTISTRLAIKERDPRQGVRDHVFDLIGRNPHDVGGVTYDPHTMPLTPAIRSYKINSRLAILSASVNVPGRDGNG